MREAPGTDDADELPWEPRLQLVPSTWILASFNDAFSSVSVNQKKVPAKAYKSVGALPVIDQGQSFIGGYTDDESLAIDVEDGVVVFGDHTRVFKLVMFPFAPGADGIKVLKPRLSGARYAHYACMSLQFPSRGYSRHYSYLAKCKLPIAPETEQARIVSKIDELFSRIDEGERALERVQKLVERYRQSVLKAAVTGDLTREWREKNAGKSESGEALLARILDARRAAWERAELDKMKAKSVKPANHKWKEKYEGPTAPDTTDLPELPEGWVWASIDQLSIRVTKGSSPKWQGFEYQTTGIPFVRSQNIGWGTLLLADIAYLDEAFNSKESKSVVREGDVLLNIVGASVGRSAVATREISGANTNQAVANIRPVEAGLMSEFLCAFLLSPTCQSQIHKDKVDVARANFNLNQILRLPIAVPNTEELNQVNEALNVQEAHIDNLRGVCSFEVARGAALRQAILKAAFEGRLIQQDPTDAPASSLLERIAVQCRDVVSAATSRSARKSKA